MRRGRRSGCRPQRSPFSVALWRLSLIDTALAAAPFTTCASFIATISLALIDAFAQQLFAAELAATVSCAAAAALAAALAAAASPLAVATFPVATIAAVFAASVASSAVATAPITVATTALAAAAAALAAAALAAPTLRLHRQHGAELPGPRRGGRRLVLPGRLHGQPL